MNPLISAAVSSAGPQRPVPAFAGRDVVSVIDDAHRQLDNELRR